MVKIQPGSNELFHRRPVDTGRIEDFGTHFQQILCRIWDIRKEFLMDVCG